MPSRRKSRADMRKGVEKDNNTPFVDRRRYETRELEITKIEKGYNLGLIVKNEMVTENLFPLQEAIREQLDREHITRVVLNLENVPYIDTSAAGLLTEMNRLLKGKGMQFILVNPSKRVANFLDILNIKEHFDVRQLD